MIDFKYTLSNNDKIEYVNQRGETVKTYPLSELEKYVTDKGLNIEYSHDAIGGTGMVSDPNTDFKEVETLIPVSEFIDKNWDDLTERFYNFKNPISHKAKNREQETLRDIAS